MYIIKNRQKNSFKLIENLDEFDPQEFNQFHLFAISEITPQKYAELKKEQEINNMLERLKELGVDLNANKQSNNTNELIPAEKEVSSDVSLKPSLEQPAQTNTQPEQPSVSNNPEATTGLDNTKIPLSQIKSKVKKPGTDTFFTMQEIKDAYDLFKDKVERDVPEISITSYNENGIVLRMIEFRTDIGRVLPNGIPVHQTMS